MKLKMTFMSDAQTVILAPPGEEQNLLMDGWDDNCDVWNRPAGCFGSQVGQGGVLHR